MSSTPRMILAWGLGLALAAPVALAQELPREDLTIDGMAGPVRAGREAPRPRTAEFGAQMMRGTATVLPALGRDDVMDDSASQMPIGRVIDTLVRSETTGLWLEEEDGSHTWIAMVETINGSGLRAGFSNFDLPSEATVIFYDADDPREAYGPYDASRFREGLTFWSPTVYGSRMMIEYHLPAEFDHLEPSHQLMVDKAMQRFPMSPEMEDRGGQCLIDVTCDSNWSTVAIAVAHMQYIGEDGLGYCCTGSLLNKASGFDGARLFYTASHCIDTEGEAASLEAYWHWETSTCNGTPPDLEDVPRTVGATLLAFESNTDNAILGIIDEMPGQTYFLGWTTALPANPQSGVIVHHGSCVRKSISYGLFQGENLSLPCGTANWGYNFQMINGGQSGGASGGPVMDTDGRVRATVACSQSGCTFNEDAWEGSFRLAYGPVLEPFLDTPNVTYVDAGYNGVERGTSSQPFNSVIEGYFGVQDGGTIVLDAGSYGGVGTFNIANFSGHRGMVITSQNGSAVLGN